MTRTELNDMTIIEVQRKFNELPVGFQREAMTEAILSAQCEHCGGVFRPGHFCFEGFGQPEELETRGRG